MLSFQLSPDPISSTDSSELLANRLFRSELKFPLSAALFLFLTTGTFAGPDCTCRYQGSDFSIGENICLNGPNGPRMAVCTMVLNNTSWKTMETPCPSASLQKGLGPQTPWSGKVSDFLDERSGQQRLTAG